MSKAAPRIADRNAPDRGWLDQIPTDDAEAALQFCRALARQVESGAVAPVERERENFLNPHLDASAQHEAEPELSVVIPIYNEVENIAVLHDRLIRVLE